MSRGVLDDVPEREQSLLLKGAADQLQAERKTLPVKSGRNRDGR